jgi:acyl carrier protein
MQPSKQEIIETICDIVITIIKDWGLDTEVNADTLLIQDLGFTSMDTIDLIATIETRYQRKLPYDSLVTFDDGSYRSELSVDELAEFIHLNFKVARQESMAV